MPASASGNRLSGRERRALFTLCLLYMTRMLGLFMVLPVLAAYLPAYKAYSLHTLGWALGIYGLTQALLQLPFGLVSDRLGRKPVIIAGLLIFAAGSLIAALADSVYGVIIGRALQGAGAISSTIMALTADVTREQNRSKAMAVLGAGIGLSFAVAMVAGPLLAASYGLSGVFWCTVFMAAVALLLLLTAVPSPRRLTPSEALPVPALLKQVWQDRQLQRFNLGIFCLHLALTALFVVLPDLLNSVLGLAPAHHGYSYLLVLGSAFVCMVPIMIGGERFGLVKPVFIAAVSLLLLASAALAWLYAQPLALVALLWLFFLGFNLLEALLPSLVSRQVIAGGKGSAMGIYASYQFMGIAAGGVLGGWVASHTGIAGVFVFSAAMLFIWWLAALGMKTPARTRTFTLAYPETGATAWLQRLSSLDGVLDVTALDSDKIAYVKVNPARIDAAQLEAV